MIEVPSKWDIIPIHASDIGNFQRCRRYWDWTSPTRTNLRRRVEIYGVNVPLWFGTGIHYALEKYYNPTLKQDPVVTFEEWFKLQWEGGLILKDQRDITYDLSPRDFDENHFTVRGLRDILPDADHEEFQGYHDLGVGMMTFYKDYSAREDNFEVVAAESTFSIPLGFEWTDRREESPNYNKKLEVHARGKRDAIVFRYDSETHAVIDHKTAAKIDEAYFRKLENDPQCSRYIWASIEEAKMHDLPYTDINEVIYQALRKVAPSPPTILKSGFPSINRADESCTAAMFAEVIKSDMTMQDWYENNDKAQAYYNYLVDQGDSIFIQRDIATRNQHEIAATGRELKLIAMEMLDSPRIYKNPTGDWLCVNCAFRAPCLAADDGSDWKYMINDGYERNHDR